MQKIIQASKTKKFIIDLTEDCGFSFRLTHVMIGDEESYKNKVSSDDNCALTMPLTFAEFSALVEFILAYRNEFENANSMVADLIDRLDKNV